MCAWSCGCGTNKALMNSFYIPTIHRSTSVTDRRYGTYFLLTALAAFLLSVRQKETHAKSSSALCQRSKGYDLLTATGVLAKSIICAFVICFFPFIVHHVEERRTKTWVSPQCAIIFLGTLWAFFPLIVDVTLDVERFSKSSCWASRPMPLG